MSCSRNARAVTVLALSKRSGKADHRRPINRDKQIKLAFFGSDFGNVDVEEADGILFESLLRTFGAFDFWQM
jgi:hypothetical protein